jgi:hypothetical protein
MTRSSAENELDLPVRAVRACQLGMPYGRAGGWLGFQRVVRGAGGLTRSPPVGSSPPVITGGGSGQQVGYVGLVGLTARERLRSSGRAVDPAKLVSPGRQGTRGGGGLRVRSRLERQGCRVGARDVG